jgi:hypothetical protein
MTGDVLLSRLLHSYLPKRKYIFTRCVFLFLFIFTIRSESREIFRQRLWRHSTGHARVDKLPDCRVIRKTWMRQKNRLSLKAVDVHKGSLQADQLRTTEAADAISRLKNRRTHPKPRENCIPIEAYIWSFSIPMSCSSTSNWIRSVHVNAASVVNR